MHRARIGIVTAALAGAFVVIGAACGGNQGSGSVPAPVVTVAPTTTATAEGSAKPAAKGPDLNDPRQLTASAWTDDEVAEALAKDCHWDPGGCLKALADVAPQSMEQIDFVPEGQQQSENDTRKLPPAMCQSVVPLACAHVPSQSCVPDACSQSDYDCIPECDKGCVSCADRCISACEACKAPCKDDACRLECGRSCGECRGTCLRDLDQCTSAGCSAKMEACFKERDDLWTKSACPKVCPKVQSCVEKCPEIENDYAGERYYNDCAQKCMKSLGKGCPGELMRICTGDPNASVNFWAYHANRAAGN